uniref:G-protein coupled receptors family 1 profile domain-containing protein n=1 Tax=Trichogramma kaykai TaxID=54128 RepID=A0ABD2WDQ1_9HYME
MENTTNDTMSGVESGIEEDERDNDLVKVELLVLSLIFLVTLMGNSLVLFAIYLRRCRGRRQRLTRMHFFVMHLSIADLVTGLLNVLPQLAWDITFRFHGGEILCKLVKFGQPLGSYLSSYVLMATAADRYHAICYPLSYCRTTSRRSRITVYTAWILSLLLCLPQIFIFSIQEIAPGIWDCWATFDLPYAKKAYVTCVLTFTYVEICLSIWHNREVAMLESQQALQPQIRARNQSSLISKAKINTIKQTLAVVILYAASSMPFIGGQLWSAWDPYAAESAFFKGMREPDVHDTVAAEQLDELRQSLDLSHVQLRAAHRPDEIFAQSGEARSSLELWSSLVSRMSRYTSLIINRTSNGSVKSNKNNNLAT